MTKEETIDKLRDLQLDLKYFLRRIEREEWREAQAKESIIERVDKVLIREGVGLQLRLRIMNDITKGANQ
jgi:hypothetical protein